MGSSRRQLVILAILVTIMVAILWWQGTIEPPAVTLAGAPTALGGQPGASPAPGVAKTVPVVALARLKREAVEPSDTGRDPFRFSASAPAAGRAGAAIAQPPPVVRPIEPLVPAGPPPPPPIPLKLIAVFSKGAGVKIAMLSDGRGVYYGGEGAVIEGQYRIVRIRMDAVEMTYLDGRGRRTIPLSGS